MRNWGIIGQLEVSEKEACSIVRAFWEEVSPCLLPDAKLPSSKFMNLATRLSRTGHECRLSNSLAGFGLSVDIPYTYIDVGLKETHPTLSVGDTLRTLVRHGKQDLVFMGNKTSTYEGFWKEWRQLYPSHPMFDWHSEHLGSCVPIAVHLDEGTTLKKKSLMIVQWQPIMGKGTRRFRATHEVPGCNMLGDSITSRFLWGVMLARLYSGKKRGQKPLQEMLRHLSAQLTEALTSGIEVVMNDQPQTIYLVCVAIKGDWPALAKAGNLCRHFGRLQTSSKSTAKKPVGICHLCRADQEDCKSWHDVSWASMSRMHRHPQAPWNTVPHLLSAIPVDDADKAGFFKVDLFHTLHKGVFADVAANTIASCTHAWVLTKVHFKASTSHIHGPCC